MIISGGMNIYPAEIEAALEQHPGDLRRRGVRHPVRGVGRGRARHGGARAGLVADRRARSRRSGSEHLASYKVPRSVDFLDELPRTGSGKILKRQLRAPYWAGRTAQVG